VGKQQQWGCEQTKNRGLLVIKLVLFGLSENSDFWCVDRSMSYLSNSFWITLVRVVWKNLWPLY